MYHVQFTQCSFSYGVCCTLYSTYKQVSENTIHCNKVIQSTLIISRAGRAPHIFGFFAFTPLFYSCDVGRIDDGVKISRDIFFTRRYGFGEMLPSVPYIVGWVLGGNITQT